MPFMYILRCADSTFYVGSTWDLDARLQQHAAGASLYTSRRLPVTLVYCEEYARIDEAYAREKQVHGWGRRKRQALIDGDVTALRQASRKRLAKPSE